MRCISADTRWCNNISTLSLNFTFLCLGSNDSSSLVFSGVCMSGGREITLFTHTLSKSKLSSSLSAGSSALRKYQLKTKYWDAVYGIKIWRRIFRGQSGRGFFLWHGIVFCCAPFSSISDFIPSCGLKLLWNNLVHLQLLMQTSTTAKTGFGDKKIQCMVLKRQNDINLKIAMQQIFTNVWTRPYSTWIYSSLLDHFIWRIH